MSSGTEWALQLLKIKTSKRSGTSYTGRELEISPDGKLNEFISEIVDYYINADEGLLQSYDDVIAYDGSTIDKTIYTLSTEDKLICAEYENLKKAIATPDAEIKPLELGA